MTNQRYVLIMQTMDSIILEVVALSSCPHTDKIKLLSAVNSLFGLTKLSTGSEPKEKSLFCINTEKKSDFALLVIWHRIMSSLPKSVTTKAGLRFEPDKSEKGNGNTTTEPFTNLPMLRLLPAYPSLLRELPRLNSWFQASFVCAFASKNKQNQELRFDNRAEENQFLKKAYLHSALFKNTVKIPIKQDARIIKWT
jgi:hypothetical protein